MLCHLLDLPLALALALSAPADESAADPVQLEPVAVDGLRRKVPLDVPGLEAAAIDRLGAASSDSASLLRGLPGVSLYGAGGVSSLPALRGLADERVRIQVDGMELVSACPNHMNPPLSYLDPAQLARVQVYAGISPVSLGGDSIGGSIVAESRPPEFALPGEDAQVGGEVGAFARGNGNVRGSRATVGYGSEAVALRYSGAFTDADNYRAGGGFKSTGWTGRAGHLLPRDEVGSSAYRTRNHALDVAWRGERHLLEAGVGLQRMPLQGFPNQRMDLLDNDQQRVRLGYLGEFDWGTLDARGFHERVEHAMEFGPDKRYWYGTRSGAASDPDGHPCQPLAGGADSCAAGMPMLTEGRTSGLTLKGEHALSAHTLLRFGAELHRQRLDDWWPPSGGGMWPGTFININDGRRDRAALFAEWEARRGAWQLLAGLRQERVSSDTGPVQGYNSAANAAGNQAAEAAAFNALDRHRVDHNTDIALLAVLTAAPTVDLELGLASKVRSPGLYERYSWSSWAMAATMNNFVGDGNGYVGNPDLQPERAHTLSATFDWHAADRRRSLRVAPYYTHVDDFIDAAPRDGWATQRFNVLDFRNQSARLYGVDLSARTPLASGAAGQFDLEAVAGWLRGRNRDRDDGLYNIMPPNLRLGLTHRHAGWDSALELVAVAAKTHRSRVRNEIHTAGHALVNLRTGRDFGQLRIDLGIDNLFDRLYALPLGGAYLGQGRTMSINTALWPWGTAVPGAGRSPYLSATWRFRS
jgi:iron complex outermembrane recepter protein